MKDEPTVRVVMNWPYSLKERIRTMAGDRGMTELITKAVLVFLGDDASITELEKVINETRYFAQQLADQLILGGSAEERREFMMEIQFPEWIQTQGWPEEFASRVRRSPQTSVKVVPKKPESEPKPEPKAEPVATVRAKPAPAPASAPARTTAPARMATAPIGDDLFSRLKASGHLMAASDLPQPEPMVMRDLCPTCSGELIDGECWTCVTL